MKNSLWHVCSLIVQYEPQQARSVRARINHIAQTEVVACNDEAYKYVVLMESDDTALLYQRMESIHDIPGVLAVSLVYHQQDELTEDLT